MHVSRWQNGVLSWEREHKGGGQVGNVILEHIAKGIETGATHGTEAHRVRWMGPHRPTACRRKLPITMTTIEDLHAEGAAAHLMPTAVATMSGEGTMRTAHAVRDLAMEGVGTRVTY